MFYSVTTVSVVLDNTLSKLCRDILYFIQFPHTDRQHPHIPAPLDTAEVVEAIKKKRTTLTDRIQTAVQSSQDIDLRAAIISAHRGCSDRVV